MRVAWLWCVAYTAVAPQDSRERRRGEISSHLWESQHARLSPRAVGWAALRGAGSDLVWAVTCGVPRLVRSFGTPTPYVALAPVFPIVVFFALSGIGQNDNKDSSWTWLGDTGWWLFQLTILATIVYTVALIVRSILRRRRNVAA